MASRRSDVASQIRLGFITVHARQQRTIAFRHFRAPTHTHTLSRNVMVGGWWRVCEPWWRRRVV
eukprot:4845829-Alexandrium_andersonii.AAC.1